MNGWIAGWTRRLAMGAAAMLLGAGAAQGADTSQVPLYLTTAATPLMMLTLSRDEQLFKKAYPDYTDLNGDGTLDTTYQDTFNYSGYFDAKLCYGYSTTDNRFKANAVATGANGHHCNGSAWSGNFLNWVTMSRIDMLRFVLYGGNRSTQTDTVTVLERAHVPNDLHAWAKVYRGSDINSYTPYSNTIGGAISFCNASFSTTDAPRVRVASGAYPEWASTALQQCRWAEDAYDRYTRTTYGDPRVNKPANSCVGALGDNSCYDDAPLHNVLAGGSDGLVVRVEVCDPAANPVTLRESFCRQYGDNYFRPAGLLQDYAEPDANQKEGKMRFGLLTGSYSHPRSGGVLRRNIGRLANNADTATADAASRGTCQAGDEIDLRNGTFCNQGDDAEGIINTLNRLKISTDQENLGKWTGSKWDDCDKHGILNRQNAPGTNTTPLANPGNPASDVGERGCSAWGNPISEIYAEALRYLAGEDATTAFDTAADLTGLPNPAWLDPFRSGTGGNPFCANCNVLVLSSGLSSFDSDEIPANAVLERSAGEATKLVGDMEGITGGTYLAGRMVATQDSLAVGTSVNTHVDLCTAQTITSLGLVRGICPDIPSQEGSFLMAGLAWQARSQDMRPDLVKPDDWMNTVTTYTVALAENLPKFEIAIGNEKITLAPLCQANNSGTATETSSDWRSCYLGSVSVGRKTSSFAYQTSGSTQSFHTYGRALEPDGSAGSFALVWEDSQWGNDHDNDVVTMITYCVGSACDATTSRPGTATSYTNTFTGKDICWRSNSTVCTDASGSPSVASNEVLIRVENLSAYAGNAMLTGYSISGSDADGLKRVGLRPGGSNASILTERANPPSNWARPDVRKYRLGTSDAKQLENPLWYTAKYGGFVTVDKKLPLTPQDDDQGRKSWDKNNTGVPDAYFKVTDPAKLKDSLNAVFSDVLARNSSAAAIATNSTRLDTDTLIYQAKFNSADWSGQLVAYRINGDGSIGSVAWDTSVGQKIPAYGERDIFTWNDQTRDGADFEWADLSAAQKLLLQGTDSEAVGQSRLAWLAGNRADEQSGASGTLRQRTYLLGDIINSDPYFVGQLNFGYEGLPAETLGKDTYAEFRTDNRARRKMLYVGANDGMLHAFDALTGAEVFAYVPAGGYRNLASLTDPQYQHRYFVDGSPNVGDAYIGGGWKTVLVGTAGAGGSTVFALDITDPDEFDATKVLWEISAADTDFTDLGATIGYATVGRMPNGEWVAVFGNGYGSTNSRAVLYIVRLSDGALIRKIYTDDCVPGATSARDACVDTPASPNGLSTPALLVDGTRTIVAAYAGDLKGNLWKFDLSSDSQISNWEVAFTQGQDKYPLFTARGPSGEVQPITAPLEIGANPAGGYMIYFGTGQYYAVGDNIVGTNPPVQSFYGIWDKYPNPSRISTGRSALQAQQIIAEVSRTVTLDNGTPTNTNDDQQITYNLRGVTATTIDWATTTKRGWVLDLVSPGNVKRGERVVSAPRLRNGRVIFTTLIPSVDPCDAGGTSWLMEIDALSGGRLEEAVFDLDGNRLFNQGDYIQVDGQWIPASGMQSRQGIIKTPAITSAGEVEYKYAGGSMGGIEVVTERGGDRNGRQSWRQLR